jgi:hypothetical protein
MNPVLAEVGEAANVVAARRRRRVAILAVVATSILSGCSRRLVVDEVAGRMAMPSPRIADLGIDRPGTISAGGRFGIRKPAEVSWTLSGLDSPSVGREVWTLPDWSAGGHVSWTPFEGLTLTPEGFVGSDGDAFAGGGALTMGMHAEAAWIAWQVEGRAGLAWTRSKVRWRTRIESLSSDSSWLGELRAEDRSGMAPWGQCGIQLQTVIPRQRSQVWALGRWGMRDPYLLLDEGNAEVLPTAVMEFQTGAGLHHRIGATVFTIGVLRSIFAPARMESADESTEFVVQVDVVLDSR